MIHISPELNKKKVAMIFSLLCLLICILLTASINQAVSGRHSYSGKNEGASEFADLIAKYERIGVGLKPRYFDGELRLAVGYFDSQKPDFMKENSKYAEVFDIIRDFYLKGNNYKEYYLAFDGHADETPYDTNLNLSLERAKNALQKFLDDKQFEKKTR